MNLKRSLFALFMTVFALNGCVSAKEMEVSTASAIQNLNQNEMKQAALTTTVESVVIENTGDKPGVVLDSTTMGNGISWIVSKVSDGTPGKIEQAFQITKDAMGKELIRIPIPQEVIVTPKQDTIYRYGGTVSEGSYFNAKTTMYGVDCVGCKGQETGRGNTGTGIKLDVSQGVMQPDGSWKQGITYNGYYIVAADKTIPIGTILKISNHGYSGNGITPGVPFYAMVLDRGGGIMGNHLDLYAGSEKNLGLSIDTSAHQPIAEIVSVGN
ncbi:MAG: 3D domain-containing protein [Carnobacterium sp.]